MSKPTAFLDRDPEQLGQHLLQVARADRAPADARERTLSKVAAVSVGAAVATTAKVSLAAPGLGGSAGLLGLKWLAIGVAASLVGLTVEDQLARVLGSRVAEGPASPRLVVAPTASSAAPVASAAPLLSASPASSPSPDGANATTKPPRLSDEEATSAPAEPALGPSKAAFAEPSALQLQREVAALRQARVALADGKPAAALAMLAAYHREFPSGLLGTEEAALRVELGFALSDPNATELARRFLSTHPMSPLAARVRVLLDEKTLGARKP